MDEYQIALMDGSDGSWDIIETFGAVDDADANAYAEINYPDYDWYVLDSHGENINA